MEIIRLRPQGTNQREAFIAAPRPQRIAGKPVIPVPWGFVRGWPMRFREPVFRGLAYLNRMAKRPLFYYVGADLGSSPYGGFAVMEADARDEAQARREAPWASGFTQHSGEWGWARMGFLPRWFRLNSRIGGIFGDFRRESIVRHEGLHMLGFDHSQRFFSVLHPRAGRTWWMFGGRRLNTAERAELWAVYP